MEVVLDGRQIAGQAITLVDDGADHAVVVRITREADATRSRAAPHA